MHAYSRWEWGMRTPVRGIQTTWTVHLLVRICLFACTAMHTCKHTFMCRVSLLPHFSLWPCICLCAISLSTLCRFAHFNALWGVRMSMIHFAVGRKEAAIRRRVKVACKVVFVCPRTTLRARVLPVTASCCWCTSFSKFRDFLYYPVLLVEQTHVKVFSIDTWKILRGRYYMEDTSIWM